MNEDETLKSTPARSVKLRTFYARLVTGRAGVTSSRVEQAFAAVPREPFAGPPPWFVLSFAHWNIHRTPRRYLETPDGDPAFLYQDLLIALDPVRGINIGEPSLHALCLDALAPQPGDTVMQIGAGSGYYAAILAELVGPQGQVIAFEIDPGLAARAIHNLAPWPWARVEPRSGAAGDLPRAQAIYVNAGITQPLPVWLDALLPEGKLLFRLQPEGDLGGMLLVQRPLDDRGAWPARFVSRAAFISCQGEQSAHMGRAIADAFAAAGWEAVCSLHRDDAPDESCWVRGGGWWLSTRPAPEVTGGQF